MDIKLAESLVAEASDALARDQHPEAVEIYNHLWDAYKRFGLFEDAQLAVAFNHLCAALMLNDEQERLKASQRLLNAYLEEPQPKTLTCEIATRLYLLLSQGGELLPHSLQEHLLEACAPYAFELQGHCEPQLALDDPPPPHHLTLIRPSDAGLLAYLMAAHSPELDELAPWLRTVYRRHQMSLKIDPMVEEVFAYLRDELSRPTPHLVNTYVSLLSAFEWAVYSAPGLAFEWLVGLLKWEAIEGVHEELTLQISRPIERRSLLTIELHKRHATDLMNDADGARLALHHWQEVINLSEYLLEVYRAREKSRGQRNLGDVESMAHVSLSLAQAYLVHGDHIQALSVLSTSLKDANREAFTEVTLAPLVFRTQGAILERMGALEEALESYERAGKLSKLTFFIEDPYVFPVDVLAGELSRGLNPALVEVSACVIADYYRTWATLSLRDHPELESVDPWRSRVLWIHTLMIGARDHLPYETFVQTMLYLELTLCTLEDPHAPQRALTYARALKHSDAVTLCELYLLKYSYYEVDERPEELLPRAIAEHKRVFEEARSGGRGSIVRRIAMGLISLHCRLLELPAQHRKTSEVARYLNELDADIAHYAPVIARDPLNQRVGRYDVFLPQCLISEPQRAIDALIQDQRWESVRRVIWALKHLNHHSIYTPHRRDFAEQVYRRHQERFDYVWVQGGQTLSQHIDEYLPLLHKEDSDERPQATLQDREGRLEFKVFDEQVIAIFVTQGPTPIKGKALSLSRKECRKYVKRFKELFSKETYGLEENRALVALCSELYLLFIEPFRAEISRLHRLIISADHPLHELPFCAFYSPDKRFLVQQVEVLLAEVCSDTNIPTIATQSGDCIVVGAEAQTLPVLKVLSSLQDTMRFASVRPLATQLFKVAYRQDQPAAQVLCLRGNMQGEFFIMRGEEEGSLWSFTMRDLSQSLAAFQPACVIIADPISRRRAQPLIRTALSASHTAVIAIHRPTQLMQQWVKALFKSANTPYRPFSYSASLTQLRRRAIQSNLSPFEWAAFEMYIADEAPLI